MSLLVTVGSLAAVPVGRRTSLAVSAVTGVTTGPVLVAASLFSLVSAVG